MITKKFIDIPLTKNNLDIYYHRSAIFQAVKDHLPLLKGNLLDAACGAMPYREHILNYSDVTQYVGLDIETAINYSDEVQPDVTWDGKTMPFEDERFNCAIATEVLEHVPDTINYLKEVHRVLESNGVFFFTTPFLWPLHEIPHDEYRFTPYAMERILKEANFTNITIQAMGGWNASLAQMLGLWLKRSPMHRYCRQCLSTILLPVYKYLIRNDQKEGFGHKMITGIIGVATKSK